MNVVVISPQSAASPSGNVAFFGNWQQFEASGKQPLGFFLTGMNGEQCEAVALQVRQSIHRHRPVFVSQDVSAGPLTDGSCSLSDALRKCDESDGLRRSAAVDEPGLHADERLLYYLFLREQQVFTPLRDRNTRSLYRFPLADALVGDEDARPWLSSLTRRGLLEPASLVDRTRHCRKCNSAHLQFVDVCPQCASIQINKAPSLHCFTCGHVAQQDHFQTPDGMRCPKCSTHLRHIGVDYDRPLTQYACGSCQHVFVDANVISRCLDCDNQADPEDLDVHEVSALRLSVNGRAALRSNQVQAFFASLDLANDVLPNVFSYLVDWAVHTQSRHAQFNFSLVLLEFSNLAELIAAHGGPRAYTLLDEAGRRLRETLRQTDISTRTDNNLLWVFMPFASADGAVARLRKVVADLTPPGGAALAIRLATLEGPRDILQGEHCEQMMKRMRAAAR
jgi:GGDEF domain-containing protein